MRTARVKSGDPDWILRTVRVTGFQIGEPEPSVADSREVLEQDPGGRERDLGHILLLLPVEQLLDVLLFHVEAVALADCRLQ